MKLEVTFHPRLRERSYGVQEGKTWDEIQRDHGDVARRVVDDPTYVIPGGESLVQFRDRAIATVSRIVAEANGDALAVVSHGGLLGVLYRDATGFPTVPRATTRCR